MLELNKETNWLHHSPSGLGIPLYENLLFALQHLRSKNKDKFLVGKDLIDRIFPFQAGGNFPLYLHHYPTCYHKWQMVDLLVPFYWMIKEFPFLHLREKIEPLIQNALALEGLPPTIEFKRNCVLNAFGYSLPLSIPKTANEDELFEILTALQIVDTPQEDFWNQVNWSNDLRRVIGPTLRQRGYEKELTLLERALKGETAVCPKTLPLLLVENGQFTPKECVKSSHHTFIDYWGDSNRLHSLSLSTKLNTEGLLVTYPDEVPPLDRTDEAGELSLYLDSSVETTFRINGRPGICFGLNDVCRIKRPERELSLKFELLEGHGEFLAHISKGNRPGQVLKDGEAYDWVITLRTLRRGPCRLNICLEEIRKGE